MHKSFEEMSAALRAQAIADSEGPDADTNSSTHTHPFDNDIDQTEIIRQKNEAFEKVMQTAWKQIEKMVEMNQFDNDILIKICRHFSELRPGNEKTRLLGEAARCLASADPAERGLGIIYTLEGTVESSDAFETFVLKSLERSYLNFAIGGKIIEADRLLFNCIGAYVEGGDQLYEQTTKNSDRMFTNTWLNIIKKLENVGVDLKSLLERTEA